MTANGTTVTSIDRRPLLNCSCGCGQKATLPNFIIIPTDTGKMVILRGCIPAYEERAAIQKQLREIVLRQCSSFWSRARNVRVVYGLQRAIFDRQGARAARRTALRSAAVYLVGRRLGLLVSMCWRKS